MTTRLKNILKFEGIEPAETVSQEHGLNRSGILALVPDLILPKTRGSFEITADATSVSVKNIGTEDADIELYLESWHSLERAFGLGNTNEYQILDPQPYIPDFGKGAAGDDELVKITANDDVAGFLDAKVTAGSGIVTTVLNPGANETLEFKVTGADAGNIVTGAPIPVRGAVNSVGVSAAISRADHKHRLEHEVLDEGVLQGARPAMNFIGAGVGAADNPGQDRIDVTIPGAVTDGACVEASVYVGPAAATSSGTYVDAVAGSSVVVPMNGDYFVLYEGEYLLDNAANEIEIAIGVNSTVVAQADSERKFGDQANVNDWGGTSIRLNGLIAGDTIHAIFRRLNNPVNQSVHISRRRLTIIKVQ